MLNRPAARSASSAPGYDVDQLRRQEFSRLDRTDTAYLDYTGAALYPDVLVRGDLERLSSGVYGNPHSESAAARRSTDAIERARILTLRFLDANPADYDVVFTANASAAIRILAEAFPFGARSRLVATLDNHNSVNGLRQVARNRRATVATIPLTSDLRAVDPAPYLPRTSAPALLAFPAQSNFSGVRHPLSWVGLAQRNGYRVLLDAAAYVGTNRLSLTQTPADYVAISYYKIFGYPTGVGALVVRRDALAALERRFFGGGTVQFVSVQHDLVLRKPGGEAYEDGTPSFLSMPAVCDGLEWLEQLGMPAIERHVRRQTLGLLERLKGLGDRVVIYGPTSGRQRGGTVAFNVRRDGDVIPYDLVETAARRSGLAVRGGCFCNPGAAECALGYHAEHVRACMRQGVFSADALRACLGGTVGAVRASVGIPTTDRDLDRLADCLEALSEPASGSRRLAQASAVL